MPETDFTVRRRPSRIARAVRALFLLLLTVAGVAVVVRLVAGGDPVADPGIAPISMTRKVRVVAQNQEPPSAESVDRERDEIIRLIRVWYRGAFVDPSMFRDGEYATVRTILTEEAAAAFDGNVNALTIGEAATDARRVLPDPLALGLTIYFDAENAAELAVATVQFSALATLQDPGADPIRIEQRVTYHFRKTPAGWRIFAFDARQQQRSEEQPV